METAISEAREVNRMMRTVKLRRPEDGRPGEQDAWLLYVSSARARRTRSVHAAHAIHCAMMHLHGEQRKAPYARLLLEGRLLTCVLPDLLPCERG